MRIVVTCAYTKSLHAVALIHQLSAQGHDVVACLNVRMLNLPRLRFYLRQLGWRNLLRKVWDRLIVGDAESPSAAEEVVPMLEYLSENAIRSRSVSEACKRVGVQEVKVSDLNSRKSLQVLREAQADLVVYAGGGILREEFLALPKLGVLNAHSGPLPQFRGMNSSEWTLFHGVRPTVTIHYIERGVDTGPIFFQRPIPDDAWTTIARGRGQAVRVSVEALIEAVNVIAEGNIHPAPQDPKEGRQFFVMAEPLLEVLQRWLDEARTPVMDASSFSFSGRR